VTQGQKGPQATNVQVDSPGSTLTVSKTTFPTDGRQQAPFLPNFRGAADSPPKDVGIEG
jgi:hypothetical protein